VWLFSRSIGSLAPLEGMMAYGTPARRASSLTISTTGRRSRRPWGQRSPEPVAVQKSRAQRAGGRQIGGHEWHAQKTKAEAAVDYHVLKRHLLDFNGGRSRARTADLLLVRPVAGFFWLSDFYPVLWNFNNLGNLLFAQQTTQMARINGVLIRF
jgi:hypothetical protein